MAADTDRLAAKRTPAPLAEDEQELWAARAKRLLEQALYEIDDRDVLPIVTAAETALRIQVGELPPSELDGYPFPGEPEPVGDCICPPDLLARGGHRGGCPVHG